MLFLFQKQSYYLFIYYLLCATLCYFVLFWEFASFGASIEPMANNTRMQTMQAAINKLTEQSHGYNEQLTTITQALASLQGQLAQKLEQLPRTQSSPFTAPRQLRADFPHFSGNEDILQWIYRAERFLHIYDIPDKQKMDLVAVSLDGRAIAWFQIWEKLNQVQDWLTLSTDLQIHFGLSQFDNLREELFKLKQVSSVTNYFDAFNDLAARVYGMDDALLLDCFIGGYIQTSDEK